MSFLFPWPCGLETEEDPSSLLPEWLVIPKSFPRPCHFHPSPNPTILFIENIPFSIKGITQIASGCEATYISLTPKIPK